MLNPRYITIKEFLVDTPEEEPKGIFLLAHGAGKGMANPFMETIARGVTNAGVRVVRFHFPYKFPGTATYLLTVKFPGTATYLLTNM